MSIRLRAPHDADGAGTLALSDIACPRCGGNRSKREVSGRDHLYGIAGEFSAARCDDCGLLFQNPRVAESDIGALYPADYGPHADSTAEPRRARTVYGALRDALWASHLRDELGYDTPKPSVAVRATARFLRGVLRGRAGRLLIPRFRSDAAVLEVGCGAGDFLSQLRDLGWANLTGIELVPEAVERARSKGLEVRQGDALEQLAMLPAASFDVVIASMVLEHLPSPFTFIDAVARVLKPGGQFLFSTIVSDSWEASHYGGYWAGYDFPRHLVYMTRDDLRQAVSTWFDGFTEFPQHNQNDLLRSSTWRAPEGRFSDRLILAAPSWALWSLSVLAAWRRRSTRASFRCTRRT
jgi:SAM-dependent methyltransferase